MVGGIKARVAALSVPFITGIARALSPCIWERISTHNLKPYPDLHSVKAITRPVLPPTFLRALPAPWRAPEIAGPADDVTFDRPSDAFDVADAAASFDFAAACAVASDVDEECLMAVRRNRNCDCRNAERAAGAGIVGTCRQNGNNQR